MSTAVVLSGGGAKGAFQVGVLQKLTEAKPEAKDFYGTSVGALNAAGMVYLGAKKLEEFWLEIEGIGDILSRNFPLTLPWRSGYYSMEPLRKKLDRVIIDRFQSETATVCYVDLADGSIHYCNSVSVSNEVFKKCTLASASIPFAMEPVDGHLADGGIREQAPLRRAIRDGHEAITVIMCNPITPDPVGDRFDSSFPELLTNGLRAIEIMEHEVMLNDIKTCFKKNGMAGYKEINLKIIAPPRVPMDTLDFSPKSIRAAIEMGKAAWK